MMHRVQGCTSAGSRGRLLEEVRRTILLPGTPETPPKTPTELYNLINFDYNLLW
jgi:hypothetical protein